MYESGLTKVYKNCIFFLPRLSTGPILIKFIKIDWKIRIDTIIFNSDVYKS